MKKIFAVVICAILLTCAVSLNTFALSFYSEEEPSVSPVIDGKINIGEYAWTTTALDKKTDIENTFYVITPHIDGQALTVEYLLSYDEENIYFAIAERTLGYITSNVIDLVYCTPDGIVKGNMKIELNFTRDGDMTEAYAPTFNSFMLDGEDFQGNISKYITDAKGFYRSDDVRNNNYIEMKLDRAAIEEFVETDVVGLGVRVISHPNGQNDGETVFGDKNSIAYPNGSHGNIGYHFFGLEKGAVDNLKLESDIVVPDDTESQTQNTTQTQDTKKPETEAIDSKTESTVNSETPKKKGCFSAVSLFGIPVIACLAVCIVEIKKKR